MSIKARKVGVNIENPDQMAAHNRLKEWREAVKQSLTTEPVGIADRLPQPDEAVEPAPGSIVDYHRGTIVPYTHNGFQFNEYGVCLNPRVIARHHGKKIQWQLSIAQAITDEWCNAIKLDYFKTAIQGGMGEPCSRANYSSDTQALEAGLERVWRLLHDLLISLHDRFEPPRPDDIKAVLAAMDDAKEPRDLQPYRDQWEDVAKRAEKRLGYRIDYPLDRGRIVPKPFTFADDLDKIGADGNPDTNPDATRMQQLNLFAA